MGWLPSFQGIWDNFAADILKIFALALWTFVMTWWVKKAHRVRYYISPPFLVLLSVGIFGLSMWTLNQARDFFHGGAKPVGTTLPSVIAPPPGNLDLVVGLSMSPEELRETIRKWLDDFRFQIRSNTREDAYFSFIVQGANSIRFEILRMKKEREQFITILGLLAYSKDDQKKVESLPEPERRCIFAEIGMELRRQKIISVVNLPQAVSIQARVPIPELTQAKLLERIDDVDYAMSLTALKLSTLIEYGGCRDKVRG